MTVWAGKTNGPTRFPRQNNGGGNASEGEALIPVEKLLFATPRRDVEPAIDTRGNRRGREGSDLFSVEPVA